MKETPREKQLVSCPLDELVDAILGDADSGAAGTVIPGALPSSWTDQKAPA